MSQLDNAIDQATQQVENETKSNKLVSPSSIKEFREKNGGKAFLHHQDLKTTDGEAFTSHGIRFGQVFAAFSKAIIDNNQGKTPSQIAHDVIDNPDKYQVRHKADKDTKEPLFNANNQPIMIVDEYRPLGVDDEEL